MSPNRLCTIWIVAALLAVLPLRGQNSISVGCPSQAAAGGAVACPVALSLVAGVTVDSLTLGVSVTPNGLAPALTQGQLSFSDLTGGAFSATAGTANAISVVWYNLSSPLGGSMSLGSVGFGLPAGAAIGRTYSVTITGASASLADNVISLGVGVPATVTIQDLPALLSVNPNAGLPGQTLGSVSITGRNTSFSQGFTVAGFGAGFGVNSLTVTSPTSATVSLTIASNAAPGARDVSMTTGGEFATLAGGFTVSFFSPCDLSHTGSTSVTDVQQLVNEALGVFSAGHDLNSDGAVTVVEVQMMISAALGLACS